MNTTKSEAAGLAEQIDDEVANVMALLYAVRRADPEDAERLLSMAGSRLDDVQTWARTIKNEGGRG